MQTKSNHTLKDIVKVSDLYLIAFLKSSGLPILKIERESRSKIYFIFPHEAEDKILEYHNGAKVEAVRFSASIQEIKTLIYDVK